MVMQVDVPQNATGEVGLLNEGYLTNSILYTKKLMLCKMVGNGYQASNS